MVVQSSPLLPHPRQLASDWLISAGQAEVVIALTDQPADPPTGGAPSWGLHADAAALQPLGLGDAAAWRPATDGIALVGSDGRTVAFFSAEPSGRYVHRVGGVLMVLARSSG